MERKCPNCGAVIQNLDTEAISDLEDGSVEFDCPNRKCKVRLTDNRERTEVKESKKKRNARSTNL